MMKVAYPLGLFVCLFIYIAYIKWHWVFATQAFFSITEAASGVHRGQQTRDAPGTAARGHKVFYGIMFDAGSTGTRVHIFQLTWQPGGTSPSREPCCLLLFLLLSWDQCPLPPPREAVVSQGMG